ncbi:extracellular solute-binding protein [Glycomyces mayteni]|uniref:Extracellular solute-binding protein n=1 Tax=Glycomyces mayteni TaxID=543887 RepID=A0ABW2D9A2_9ACTN|nr:ABC transporter substrate-binding protein [Glycomyces mayteni]
MTSRWRSRPRLSRRTVLELLGGAAAVAAVGGAYWLGGREREDEWEDLGGRPLRLLASRDETANGQRRLLVDQWNAWHPGHPAEMVELPPIADLQYTAIHAALQAEDPDVDVVDLDVPWVAEFAVAGRLEPLDGADTGGFLERPLEAGRFEGELYALPFNTNVGMLYYRKRTDSKSDSDYRSGALTEMEAASIRTWQDLRDTIAVILQEDNGFAGGIAMQLASYEGFTVNVWEFLLANQVEVAAGTGMIDFGPRSDALGLLERLWSDLWEPVAPGKSTVLPAAVQHNEDESLAAFQAGLTPFLRHWPQAIRTLESCEAFAAVAADVPFEVGVVPMPGGVLGGGSLAVSAYSERKTVSRALIEFLTGPVSQQLLFERGGFAAARPEPYFDAMAQLGSGVADGGCESAGGPRQEAAAMYEALTGEGPGQRPEVDRYTQFSYAFRDELHDKLANGDAPDFSGLADRLERAVDGR